MSFSSIFENFGHALHSGWERIFGTQAAKQLLEAQVEILKQPLGQFALKAVQEVLNDGVVLTPAGWEIVAAKIAAEAVVMGYQVGEQELTLLVSLLVAFVQAKAPTSSAPAAPVPVGVIAAGVAPAVIPSAVQS